MQTYVLILIENYVRQLAQIPAYFYFTKINTTVIIMNNIH